MVRQFDLRKFALRFTLGFLPLLFVSCYDQVDGGGAADTTTQSSGQGRWGTARDNALATYVAKITLGKILKFKSVDKQWLKDPTVGALLEVEFKDGKEFSLDSFSVALNGITAGQDCSAASSWEIDAGKKKLYVGLAGLTGTDGTGFSENALFILSSNGDLTIWLTSPGVAVAARLIFFKKTPPPPPKDPTVVFDQLPAAADVGTSAVFKFHSPEGATAFECALDGAKWAACASPSVYSNLATGSHKFEVHALSAAGKKGPDAKFEFTLKPVVSAVKITKVDPASSPNASNVLTVTFTVTTTNLNVPVVSTNGFCQLDGGQVTPCTSPVKFVGLAEGAHTVRLTALVATDNNPATYSWIVDRTPPRLAWTATPKNTSTVVSPTFSFSTSEPASFTCELDRRVGECASPVAVGTLADGNHTLIVRGVDAAGNQSEPLSYVWAIDTVAPEVRKLGALPAEPLTRVTSLSLSFTASEPASFACALDNEPSTSCSSPVVYRNLADGAHRVRVTAVDIAGNVSPAMTHEWTVDTGAPTLLLTRVSPDRTPTNLPSARLTFSSNETSSTFTCAVDGAAPFGCTSPVSLASLTEGAHSFSVTATDGAGNVSQAAATAWVVDFTPPRISLGAATPADAITTSRSFSLDYTVSEDAVVACNLDEAGDQACPAPFNVNNLADGKHTVVLTALDTAGNASRAVSYSWEVMSQARVTINSAAPAAPRTKANEIVFEFSSINTQQFVCRLDGAAPVACTSPQSYKALTDGDHVFTVSGVNVLGVAGTPATYNWAVDTTAPRLTLGDVEPAGALTTSATIKIAFSADEPATFRCAIDDQPASACGSPLTTASLVDGRHVFSVYATDLVGNSSAASTYAWTIDTGVPGVNLGAVTPATSPSNARDFSAAFTSDDATATFLCVLDGGAEAPCVSPFRAVALGDGAHRFAVRARDAAGNVSAAATHGWTIDTVLPVVTLSATPSGNPTNSPTLSLAITSTKQASYTCTLDGSSVAECANFSGLLTGNHVVAVSATDGAGNVGMASYAWTVDTVVPVVAIIATRPIAVLTNSTTVGIDFSVTKEATLYCALDGAAATTCRSPYAAQNLTDGAHTFTVYAKDAAGNRSLTVGHSWTVDTVAPTLTLGTIAPAGSVVNAAAISVAFSAAKTNTTFTCALDGAPAAGCTSPFTATALADGHHAVAIRATDGAGNQSELRTYGWTIDTIPPVVKLESRMPASSPSNATTMAATFSVNKEGSLFFCALDGGPAAPCVTPFAASGLAEGEHSFAVYAKDAAGNQSASAGFGWAVDTTAPVVQILTKSPAVSPTKVRTLGVTFAANEPTAVAFCAVDGGATTLCDSPYSTAVLADGAHTVSIYAQDKAGNQGTAATYGWTIDTTAPVVTLAATPSKNPTSSTTLALAITSTKQATYTCTLDGQPAADCTHFAGLAAGNHSVAVTATDLAGNTGGATYGWTIDTTAPVVTLAATPSRNPTSSTTLALAITSTKQATYTCTLDGQPAADCERFAGLAAGNHSVTVTATDLAGNTGGATYGWTIDTTAPVVTLAATPSRNPTSSTTLALAITSTKQATYTCTLDGQPAADCERFAGLAAGNHSVTVTATDLAGNTGGATYGWTIDTTAPVVTLAATPSRNPTSSTTLALAITSTKQATYTCTLDGQAAADCTHFAGLAAGNHSVTVTATDLAGNTGGATYGWTIDTTAPVVTLAATPSKNPTSSTTLALAITSTKQATYTCTLDGQPAADCEHFAGLAAGNHSVTVTATDLAGNTGGATYGWTIDTTAPVVTLAATPSRNPTSSTTLSLAISATKSSIYTCTLDGQTAANCASFANLSAGDHVVTVSATDSAGNVGTASYAWTVDTTPPVVTVVATPSRNPTNQTTMSLALSATKTSTYECTLDGQTAAGCGPFAGLSAGNHSVTVVATDAAGNHAQPVTYAWTIDTTAPVVSIASLASPTSSMSATITFGANEAGANFTCSLDGATAVACTSPFQATNLSNGAHSLSVVATDPAGNASAAMTTGWTIDTVAPTVSLGAATPAGALVKDRAMNLAFSANETGATFNCALDGAAAIGCSSPFTAANLGDGNHSVAITARDAAGNVSTTATYVWAVDATAPTANIVSANPGASPTNATTISISFDANESGATFSCTLDGGTPTSCASPYGASALAAGGHSFSVTATDKAGNVSAAATYAWTIQLAPPVASITSVTPSAAVTASTSMTISFTADKPASFSCKLDGNPVACPTSPYSVTGLAHGAHSFSVVASDAAGNVGPGASYGWTVDIVAPSVTIGTASPAQSPTTSSSLSLPFTLSETSTAYCALDGAAPATCQSPYAVSGLFDGNHTIAIYAIDGAGNRGATKSYSWNIDATAPVTTITSDTPSWSPTANTSITVTFSATETASFGCALDGGNFIACSSPWTVTGLSDGPHSVSVRATDLAGNTGPAASYSWVVNTTSLVISNVSVSQLTSSSAVITWTTNFAGSSVVKYGVGNTNSSSTPDSAPVTTHEVKLTGLTANSFYSYQVSTTDRDGRTQTSSTGNFRTLR